MAARRRRFRPILSLFPFLLLSLSSSLLLSLSLTALVTVTVTVTVFAQDSNHYFCGTSWDDASNNCNERQHCQGGTDDECEGADGSHICFGGTTCDIREGHGNAFKYANVAYDDISNTRFCGNTWSVAIEDCSLGTHCPTGFSEECPDGDACYGGLSCNVKDIIEEEALKEEEEEGEGAAASKHDVPRIDKHSEKRHNFCGISWGDADATCGDW